MGYLGLLLLLVIGVVNAQIYKVCVPRGDPNCNNLERDGSPVSCLEVDSRLDCALKMARGEADIGAYSEEELLLISQMQTNENQLIATIRNQDRFDSLYSFEAVSIVRNNHTNGIDGLRGSRYCHPGLGIVDQRWSPRVQKALEQTAARTDRCPGKDTNFKTAEEVEVEILNDFFSAACRPGPWSSNSTVDARLKNQYPNLCAMCSGGNCTNAYSVQNAVNIGGVNNNNRHIQALDCLVTNGTVAYAAWLHVKEFFTNRNPQDAGQFSVLCPNGTMVALTIDVLSGQNSPCAFVRQPWRGIVTSSANAAAIRGQLNTWWPNGVDPMSGSWQSTLFQVLVNGMNLRVNVENPTTPSNFTNAIRPLDLKEQSSSCLPEVRWCTVSVADNTKCLWLSASSYVLGLEPRISCQRRPDTFQCLRDIRDGTADFFSVDSHYGYIARSHYNLSPIKLVQNLRAATSRVAAFVKENSAQANITRFENLRDKVACFPEYGGIAYVAFVRTAHERSIISSSECDYAKAVGEFFTGACAPGALDVSHALSQSSDFNATSLCSACRPLSDSSQPSQFTCAWNYTNMYFGNNGSVSCLTDVNTDVAFLETQDLAAQMAALNVNPSQYRALCRNNSLAVSTGINIDDACLLANVVDAEVLARRNDPLSNAISALLDSLETYFGYGVGRSELINMLLYSPFDNQKDLLFKDSTIGLSEPTVAASHEPARNLIELFQHLESCTGAAAPPPAPGMATRLLFSFATLFFMSFFVMY